MKRSDIWRLFLAVSCLLLLTACGKTEEQPKQLPYEMPEQLNVAYLPEYTKQTIDCSRIVDASIINGTAYILSHNEEPGVMTRTNQYGEEYTSSRNFNTAVISRVEADGAVTQVYSTLDFQHNDYIWVFTNSLQTGADGTLWMNLRCIPVNHSDPDVDALCQLDAQGNQLDLIDLTETKNAMEISTVNGFALDGEGWFYLLSDRKVHVVDSQLNPQFSLDTGIDTEFRNDILVRFPDGRMGCIVWEAKGPGEPAVYEMRLIDKDAQDWGAVYPLPQSSEAAYPGGGGYLFFVNSNGHICGWSEERDALEQVVNSDEVYTNLSTRFLKYFGMDPEGRIEAITCPDQDQKIERLTLTPADPASLPEKTTLTLGCLGASDSLRSYVNDFNRSNQDCQIELVEYSSDPHIPMEGYDRMIVEITAGNVPDILCVDRLPAEKFGAKGIFEDLWPYIENDPDLGRDALMAHVLECAEQDGKLYYVFDSFSIMTAAAPASVVGDRLGWTLEDMQAVLAQMPEGCSAYSPAESKHSLLYNLFNADMGRYMDWEAGTCSFDGEDFRELLGYVNSLDIDPERRGDDISYMESLIQDGRQMLYYSPNTGLVKNFFAVQTCGAVLGGPVSFVGDPKEDGSCGSAFDIGFDSVPLAMTKACKDREAAWSFMRELLLPRGGQAFGKRISSVWRFPINREDFEELYRLSAGIEEEGVLFANAEGEYILNIDYAPVSEAEYNQIMELYQAVDSIYSTDEDIWEIILSEALPYFAGERSLEDTVARIQSRATLYINEQK